MALLLISAPASQSGTSEDYQEAYDKAFRSSYRISSIQHCLAAPKSAAAAKIDLTPVCVCLTDRLLATKSVEELKIQPPSAELRSLVAECFVTNPPKISSGKL